ncbi:MAG: type II CAAX endopeptidase family protein [Clostridium sp.]|nr:type II CAAX endopeptidase family protein [Clostridium sp.]MDU7084837.1 type II CAAX endopeptidase family protein [Clostridium sp.]
MENRKSAYGVILIVIISGLIMAYIDAIISPPYFIKSIFKIITFLALPFLLCRFNKSLSFKSVFKLDRKSLKVSLALGIAVYIIIIIIGAYFTLGGFFDFSNVTKALNSNMGVNARNFVYVALYISFINSLLEEFFFRGFAFLNLKRVFSKRFAYVFSSISFALYHIAMMVSWFDPILFVLLIVSLFCAGMLFDWLNDKYENIYCSWLVHMCANFAINTVGFMLFEII